MNTVRVALAEDNVLLREGMSRLVAANNDFELVGVASDLPQLLALVAEQAPDVVVTDIRMPPTGTDEGIKAAGWVREHYPQTGVVVLSQYVAPKYAVALLEHGSAGRAYLLKERVASVDELARAIRDGRCRRVGDRPHGGRRAGQGARCRALIRAVAADRPRVARSSGRWRRARATRRSPPRCT